VKRKALLALLLALVTLGALGALATSARADGDPGSDVLVYQNLFIAADANVSVPQQLELGNLLSAAGKAGFPVRVAIVSQPSDLGAVTALWRKPAAYASFLGTELSLAYAQRLLIVMPNGFGFNWQGHPAGAAYSVLGGVRVAPGGAGLATAAQSAVLALARASGVRLAVPSADPGGTGGDASGASSAPGAGAASGAGGAASGDAAQGPHAGGQPVAASARPGGPVPLTAGIALGVLAAGAAGGWLLLRGGRRPALPRSPGLPRWPGRPARPGAEREAGRRRAVPGTWLAGGFVGLATLLIVVHAVVQPSARVAQDGTASASALTANQNLDPGLDLSAAAPAFTLTDQFGQPVSLSSFRGKVVILAFNDAECTTICPLTTAALVDAKEMLGAAGSQVQLLGVDANPKAIAVEDLLSYSQLHGMTYQWRYLTGSLAQLQSVWKAYSVGVTISQSQTDHEPAIFVINQQGRLAKLFLTQLAYSAVGQLGQLLASEVSSLLPAHPAVDSHLSYAQIGGISPATATTLPAAGGGYVNLGPGQTGPGVGGARLYLFFATWDREITSLGGQLDALNAYQSAATAAGLPGLTAIDEGSVEPSPSALPGFLSTLRQPLSYPVAIDGGGQVADGYGVQGAPWFTLTAPDGKVIWSWEVSSSGWPSAAALDQHVRGALAAAAKSPA
jgi:cytochrome oxidase Cu insertion factor (SCO1/SenC/PrrC family)